MSSSRHSRTSGVGSKLEYPPRETREPALKAFMYFLEARRIAIFDFIKNLK